MSKIDLSRKLAKLQTYRSETERKSLRYKKLIAEIVKYIVLNNDKYLTNNDLKQISIKVYKKHDRIIHQRIRSMMTQEVVKNDINNELQRILTDRAINPLLKVVDLTQRGEEVAKNTSDFINVAKFYKEIAEIEPKKGAKATYQEKTIDYSTIGKEKITTKTIELSNSDAITSDINDDLGNVNSKPSPENS